LRQEVGHRHKWKTLALEIKGIVAQAENTGARRVAGQCVPTASSQKLIAGILRIIAQVENTCARRSN
jgi:hypothetical protein